MSANDTTGKPVLTEEENKEIWERQNFLMHCIEMERITDEIIVPYFSNLSRAFKPVYPEASMILMDCESPLDYQLYNLGLRFTFQHEGDEAALTIVADPTGASFDLTIEAAQIEPRTQTFSYQEVIPQKLDAFLIAQITELFPAVKYEAAPADPFEQHNGPFRVQYDDHGNISDVATTKTLKEAASMASTFAKMFNNEKGITILNAKDEVIC